MNRITLACFVLIYIFSAFLIPASLTNDHKECAQTKDCFNEGTCDDGNCTCPVGWGGDKCQHCQGRFLLTNSSGGLSDGDYDWIHFSNCMLLIGRNPDPAEPVLRLSIDGEEVSCANDFLFIYDGDGEHSPPLATYSGLVRPTKRVTPPAVTATSGMAYLHFKSESGVVQSGYKIRYWYEAEPDPPSENDTWYVNQYLDDWAYYEWLSMIGQGRASTAATLNNGSIYLFGGYVFGEEEGRVQMLKFDPVRYSFDSVFYEEGPSPRFGHAMVSCEDQLLVFGGIVFETYTITNEIWAYNATSLTWSLIHPSVVDGLPLNDTEDSTSSLQAPSLVGHTVHVLTRDGWDIMLVIFGYHPEWEYSNFVFEYNIANNTWSKVETTGVVPYGSYGHASALDEINKIVYVHGGVKDKSSEESAMYVYDVENRIWSSLREITLPRYLHSMAFLSNKLLVFGGTAFSTDELCVDVPFQMYDIATDTWKDLDRSIQPAKSGFGQVIVPYGNTTMFIFGGYDGVMRSDLLIWELNTSETECDGVVKSDCKNSPNCIWSNDTCIPLECPSETENIAKCDDFCSSKTACMDCLSTALKCCNCSYCPDCQQKCFYGLSNTSFTNSSECDESERVDRLCASFPNCDQCAASDDCYWHRSSCRRGNEESECEPPCSNFTSCSGCTAESKCDWCETTATCIPKSATLVYYPYGTCTDLRRDGECDDPCLDHTSCDDCSDDASCGWCAINSATGLGTCLSGSYNAPLVNDSCVKDKWHFIDCPECQCNGHSTCDDGDDACTDCEQQTTGDTCGICETGYYGNAVNGGNCSECECNGHADDCDDNGQCYCRVRGMTGSHCDSCLPSFDGNPVNGSCFYSIFTQLRYYFNLLDTTSNEYITQMNFDICPTTKSDLLLTVNSMDTGGGFIQEFDIDIKYNYTGNDSQEMDYGSYYNKTFLKLYIRQSTFHFGRDPLCCLRFYLNFHTPIYFSISLQQTFSNVGVLLGVFFSCFLILLIVAIIVWKINSICTRYHHRQRREIELKVMASRPLATVDFEFEKDAEMNLAITNELLSGGKGSVTSALLWLPYGNGGSQGDKTQSYFAIGSALSGMKPDKCQQQHNHIYQNGSRDLPSSISSSGVDNPVLELEHDRDDSSVTTA